jgi:hypothetical protein
LGGGIAVRRFSREPICDLEIRRDDGVIRFAGRTGAVWFEEVAEFAMLARISAYVLGTGCG